MIRGALAVCCLLVLPAGLAAQSGDETVKEFVATRSAAGTGISVDGRVDDPAWQSVQGCTDFRQKVPVEGGAPTGATEVAFVYDDDALYVGARMRSADASRIPRTVTRRDQYTNAEHLIVALDTYHDRRTAYSFSISSGGVRGDYYHPSDAEGSRDMTWDPIWQAKASVDSTGWIAELRIPFSQLRFGAAGAQTWGVQINRWMPNVNEDVYWVVIPARETGWASRFGTLRGVEGVKPSRRMELVPYVASNGTFDDQAAGNPFRDGSDVTVRAGADFKMGLGPNLTLDATVNPDFGQVEADPAEVNLSAFETFFDERRPFFTEGAQLLRGGGQNFFYSRRIGQSPRGFASGDFVDRPTNATILGAAKLTGRLRNGLSVGGLTAFTAREEARTFDAGTGDFGRTEIEPFTAYGVGRVQKEFGPNSSVGGLSITGVRRELGDSPLETVLPGSAITGGGDVNLRTAGAAYEFGGSVSFSHVRGDPAAILRIQQAPAHFMQRPDATEFTLDPTRSSLTGWAGSVRAAKNSGRHWVGNTGLSFESPNFELNDIGRLGSANDIDAYAQLTYRETEPGKIFQRYSLSPYIGRSWNFGGVTTGTFWSLGNSFTFRNFYRLFLGTYGNARALSDDLTRGGPLMGVPAEYGFDVEIASNDGRATSGRVSMNYENDEVGGWSRTFRGGLSARPGAQWRVSVDPTWNKSVSSRQYVSALPGGSAATFGTRYIFAYVRRSTISARIRLNYALTPDLGIELYAEPFAASGTFYDFGELSAARSRELRTYGTDGTTITTTAEGYEVTDGNETFIVPNRDFNVLSFRSNLVLRWEWLRGSTLFLVWQQNRAGDAAEPVRFGSLFDTFDSRGTNFVAVKASYWLSVN